MTNKGTDNGNGNSRSLTGMTNKGTDNRKGKNREAFLNWFGDEHV
jgi:hypothetical protein